MADVETFSQFVSYMSTNLSLSLFLLVESTLQLERSVMMFEGFSIKEQFEYIFYAALQQNQDVIINIIVIVMEILITALIDCYCLTNE